MRIEEMTTRQGLYHPLNEEFGLTARNVSEIIKSKDINSLYIPKKELDTTCVTLIYKNFFE